MILRWFSAIKDNSGPPQIAVGAGQSYFQLGETYASDIKEKGIGGWLETLWQGHPADVSQLWPRNSVGNKCSCSG